MTEVRLLVADDHEVVRRGIRALLETEPGWTVCAEAANGREAVERAAATEPDVAILDVSMPELNGFEAARQIRKTCPRCEVLILTMHESEAVLRDALAAGVRGYVLKSDAGRMLIAAVDAVRQHKSFLTPAAADMVLADYRRHEGAGPGADVPRLRLSPREREVVQLLAEGKSTKAVARTLGISVKTADTHRTNVMRKLALHSQSELVRYAIRNNLIQP
ncbi:MAG TPA: response regulator transcription factor [Candidatus Limnocylindria bacterium]|nr:response regulator transcription factor [Candidatus Limnocylindria bacterium]